MQREPWPSTIERRTCPECTRPDPIRERLTRAMARAKALHIEAGLVLDELTAALMDIDQLAAELRDGQLQHEQGLVTTLSRADARRRLTGTEHEPVR